MPHKQVYNYVVSDEKRAQIESAYTYHAPKSDQPARYVILRDKAKELAIMICELTPDTEEQKIALACLSEAVMWANKSIACNE